MRGEQHSGMVGAWAGGAAVLLRVVPSTLAQGERCQAAVDAAAAGAAKAHKTVCAVVQECHALQVNT